jgi:crotonobetainyl-CoA:carnitine CoA-transferase CaiB-like acyl-CoA transferase
MSAMDLDTVEFAPQSKGPLAGVRALDLSRLMAGNMLSLQLADFGADVIKVEPPGVGDTLRHWKERELPIWWKVYARNKKSITVNTRSKAGVMLLKRLLPSAQILIESFRPGVLEAMGLGLDVLHSINPKLVLVRLTGWGQTGPYRSRPGFGTLIEGFSGFAAKNGFPDKPPALPNLGLADMVAGLTAASATLIALREAEKEGGKGQMVDVSLLEPLMAILGPDAALYKVTGRVAERTGNRTSITAPRNAYETRDGQWLVMSGATQRMTERLFDAIGRPDMKDDPRFRTSADRIRNIEALDEILGEFVRRRTLAENLEFFENAQVTFGPINDAFQVTQDRHVRDRGILVELPDADLGRIPMHAVTPRLSGTPGSIRTAAPHVGQHNGEVYGGLGLTASDLAALASEGAI